jgi:Tfp pilus assembly protein PilE
MIIVYLAAAMKTTIKRSARLGAIGLLSVFALIGTAIPVSAQTAPAQPTTPKTVKFSDACKNIKNRLKVRVGNVNDAKDENTTVYESLNKRLEKIISAAEKQKYDTTELKAALVKNRTAIETYTVTNKAYTTELTATANSVCQSETNYKLAIATTRTALKTAREAGVATRDSFQYDAIPALRAYKVWLNDQKSSSTTEEPEATDTSKDSN